MQMQFSRARAARTHPQVWSIWLLSLCGGVEVSTFSELHFVFDSWFNFHWIAFIFAAAVPHAVQFFTPLLQRADARRHTVSSACTLCRATSADV